MQKMGFDSWYSLNVSYAVHLLNIIIIIADHKEDLKY